MVHCHAHIYYFIYWYHTMSHTSVLCVVPGIHRSVQCRLALHLVHKLVMSANERNTKVNMNIERTILVPICSYWCRGHMLVLVVPDIR